MSPKIRFCFVLHNHQPIGNFDGVFEQAYQDSYLPFLNVLDDYPALSISLHTSGPLMEWLDQNHEDYVNRLANHVRNGRIEIVGGAFYEPILTMIPTADRIGQITSYSEWLERRLGCTIQGMWIPERVWEQSLASDLVDAGIKYTLLDDFHFKNAGLIEEQLTGYYITEDDGRLLSVFPGSERLRYLIPFGSPQETIDHLGHIAGEHPGAVAVFGDDGEKLGTWPETKQHVYDNGWLRQFFDLLMDNRDWLQTSTLSEVVENLPPLGKIYLPEGSYREMTEWSLPVERQSDYENLVHQFEHDARWDQISSFVRGGFWRNFRRKYPEADEMYSRMMAVSRRLQSASKLGGDDKTLEQARQALYRGQCNCSYWHGAFGGIYLPHLRNAIYHHLITAEQLIDKAVGKGESWVEAIAEDFNFDARQEVRLANDKLTALLAPAVGGHLYELDVNSISHNLLATLTRRPEVYHRKVLAGADQQNGNVASIHDRVVFKQEGLEQRIQYDLHPRKCLLDHFYDDQTTHQSVSQGEAAERGDFLLSTYEAILRRNPDRIQVQLSRSGQAHGIPIKITKGLTLQEGSSTLDIGYLLEGLPKDRPLHFSVEFNFAGLPAGADDRYFYQGSGDRLGQLGTKLDIADVSELGMVDEWLGIDLRLSVNQPTNFWTFPIESVSQSEGGFELVHQSVVVQPHWFVQGDAEGRWSATIELSLDTTLAESRHKNSAVVIAG